MLSRAFSAGPTCSVVSFRMGKIATTGGVQLPETGRSVDHVTLVTVDDDGVDIANLLLSGILDKTGRVPLNGDEVCFEVAVCGSP